MNNEKQRIAIANSSSRFKGVSSYRGTHWQASIKVNNKAMWLGSFSTEEMAARAYDDAARIHFGEHVYLNYP